MKAGVQRGRERQEIRIPADHKRQGERSVLAFECNHES
jgi:hypothetical protein